MSADGEQDTAMGHGSFVNAASAYCPELAERASEIEALRHLPQDLADRLARDGFYTMVNPPRWGGAGATPLAYAQAVQALSRGDAAPAWCTFISITAAYGMAFANTETVRRLLSEPGMIAAGVFAPMGRAVKSRRDGVDGYVVTGRWAWGSGTQNAHWISGGCFLADKAGDLVLSSAGKPVHLSPIFAADQIEIIDTWTVSGLQGTGSTDFEVKAAFVPADRVIHGFGTGRDDEAIFRFPAFGLLGIGIAAVALGTARGALDDFYAFAGGKTGGGGRKSLAERSSTHRVVAMAEADTRQGLAFFQEAIEAAWHEALAGPVSLEQRRDLRLAMTSAVQSAKRAVDAIYELAGGASVYRTSPIQRRFRDVHVATQHMMVSASTWELTGRLFLGQPTDTAQL